MTWQVSQLRATFFTNDPQSLNGRDVWERIAHSQPEEIQENPNQRTLVVAGPAFGANFIVQMMPDRINLVLLPQPGAKAPPSAGSYEHSAGPFSEAISTWVEEAKVRTTRVAFAPELFHLCPDKESAIQMASSRTRSLNLQDSSSIHEFRFKINRRRTLSEMPDVTFNRLAEWNSAEGREMVMHSGTDQPPATRLFHLAETRLDINNVPLAQPASAAQTQAMFSAVVKMADELATEGECS